MTEDLYLIAHKVRGREALDVAIRMPMPDGVWWIIPTSGHRAYPYWNCTLDVIDGCLRMEDEEGLANDWNIPPMPPDLPDHYPAPPAAASRLTVSYEPKPEDL